MYRNSLWWLQLFIDEQKSLNLTQTILSAKGGIRFLVLILHYYLPQFRSPKEKLAENIPNYPVFRLRSPNSFFPVKVVFAKAFV